jgi:DNA processing protein
MSPESAGGQPPPSCGACLARSELLALLSARIEHAAIDSERLLALLCLQDEQLIEAVGGRRREEFHRRREEMPTKAVPAGVIALCRHHPLYQRLFRNPHGPIPAPSLLHASGKLDQLSQALQRPIVALVGAAPASDYGLEMACALARSLTRSGLGVISLFGDGVPAAAHLGVLEAAGTPLSLTASGLDICKPQRLRALRSSLLGSGIMLSELPCGFRGRRWSERAGERIIALIASLVIVIESDLGAGMLAAELASTRGIPVGALPGRVTSPHSRGPHRLLKQGATLIASAQDALDLLYGVGNLCAEQPLAHLSSPSLELLERIGSGAKAPQCPLAARASLTMLSELRSAGLLARGDDGRYLPRVSLDERPTPPRRSSQGRAP